MRETQHALHITLYVMGRTPRSERAIANLHQICGREMAHCELIVIDVLEEPQVAEAHKVIATPTLIKRLPPPTRRIIGDLSDIQRVANLLGLSPGTAPDVAFEKDKEGAS